MVGFQKLRFWGQILLIPKTKFLEKEQGKYDLFDGKRIYDDFNFSAKNFIFGTVNVKPKR